MLNKELHSKQIERLQIGLIVLFSIIPLFVILPFKINLFLAWEGAYRISLGQIPFKDFSLPVGFGFWILPALFFKIFGPYLYTLVITQVFINILGALAFRSILKKLGVNAALIFLSLIVYCVSFILVNFWPWYNHSVFIFELVGINFLLGHIFEDSNRKKNYFLVLACFFLVLSFFTKQDGGGLAILTGSALIFYNALADKKIKWILYSLCFSLAFTFLFVLPFLPFNFSYWFNYGQAPHNARINLNDILLDIFEGSHWIKFYFFCTVVVIIHKANSVNGYFLNKKEVLFAIFALCILGQAMVVQVTSYIPHNVNIYFHSVAFAFLANASLHVNCRKVWILSTLSILLLFWWSADYWRYGQRLATRISPGLFESKKPSNQVSKYTWLIEDTAKPEKKLTWKVSPYRSFKNILLPEETILGIEAIMKMEIVKSKNLKVLNMSELTSLAYEIGYEPLKNQPLWFHRNVSIFDNEIKTFCERIEHQEYDMVLFEEIPYLNQFYPEEVRIALLKNYKMVNRFIAPREKAGAFIEVYIKPTAK